MLERRVNIIVSLIRLLKLNKQYERERERERERREREGAIFQNWNKFLHVYIITNTCRYLLRVE